MTNKSKTKRKQISKNNDLIKSYKRERQRIQRRMREYEKKGLIFNDLLPDIPKKITSASVRRLKKIDLKKIRDAAVWVSPETGEKLGGFYGKYWEDVARKAAEKEEEEEERRAEEQQQDENYEKIIATAMQIINSFLSDIQAVAETATTARGYKDAKRGVQYVRGWVMDMSRKVGPIELAKKLEYANNQGWVIYVWELYETSTTAGAMDELGRILGLDEIEADELGKLLRGDPDRYGDV